MKPSDTPPVTPQPQLLRIQQVIQIVPVSRSAWWRGVRSGRFPAGVKLGSRITCWRASDIDALLRSL